MDAFGCQSTKYGKYDGGMVRTLRAKIGFSRSPGSVNVKEVEGGRVESDIFLNNTESSDSSALVETRYFSMQPSA